MKPKNIMELIFIFLLPLLFILPCVSINKEYVYDNEGNFESSDLSVDYNLDLFNDTYQLVDFHKFDTTLTGFIYIPTNLNDYGINQGNYNYLYNNNNTEMLFVNVNNNVFYNQDGNITSFNRIDTITINGINYNKYYIENIALSDDNVIYNFGYYTVNDEESTPWKSLHDLVVNFLNLKSNVVIDIIIDYTVLWFIMFIIWHFFYLFFDMLVHLFIDWKKR